MDDPDQGRIHKERVDTAEVMNTRAFQDTERIRSAVKNRMNIPRTLEEDNKPLVYQSDETCSRECSVAEKALKQCPKSCITKSMRDSVCK